MKRNEIFHTLRVWLGRFFLIFSIGFFAYYVFVNFENIPRLSWTPETWFALSVTVLLYVSTMLFISFAWRLLLKDHGYKIIWNNLVSIFFVSQFGKYLPGNVAHHVGRAYMAKKAGVPMPVAIHTLISEALLVIATAATLSFFALQFIFDPGLLGQNERINPYEVLLLAGCALFIPRLAVRCINYFFPSLARKISGADKIFEPRFSTSLSVSSLFLLSFLINGLVLQIQAIYLFGVNDSSLVEFTMLYSVAWIAGYLLPGAPGGVGIRETMMILLFSPMVGASIAVGLGISLRITTTLGDALAFAIGLLMRRKSSDTASLAQGSNQ